MTTLAPGRVSPVDFSTTFPAILPVDPAKTALAENARAMKKKEKQTRPSHRLPPVVKGTVALFRIGIESDCPKLKGDNLL